jgi:hypothetical protein
VALLRRALGQQERCPRRSPREALVEAGQCSPLCAMSAPDLEPGKDSSKREDGLHAGSHSRWRLDSISSSSRAPQTRALAASGPAEKVVIVPTGSRSLYAGTRYAVHSAMMSPGDEAARVCLDILRGASQLAQPYAAHLSKLLQEEGRGQELALVEALGGCLLAVVAAARVNMSPLVSHVGTACYLMAPNEKVPVGT